MKLGIKLQSESNERYLASFLIALGIGIVFFVPYIFMDKGIFYFYGDFNAQQIPFYMMAHNAVQNGNIFWNWFTDLGANFIGSYSFYLLGSPFFWVTLLFPNWMVPYLVGPLLILKFALSSLTAYCLFRRFVRNKNNALIGALLYAFSGFSVYNIFFNHFHEAIVFFPLLLLGLEILMADNRKGVFAAAVMLCAVSNYFFFISMAVFLVPYFIIRLFAFQWKLTVGKFISVVLETAIGIGLASFILIPSFFAVIQNSRVNDLLVGWDGIVYGRQQLYLNLIHCFFFPPDLPARQLFFPGAQAEWSSQAGWLPVFSMAGVIAFFQVKKGHWLKRMITVCIVMALIPILNASFVMFNAGFYARWFFMPVLLMALATAISIDDSEEMNWWSAFRWTAIVTVVFTVVIGLFPNIKNEAGKITRFGLFDFGDASFPDEAFYNTLRYWVVCGLSIGSLAILGLLLPLLKRSKKTFIKLSLVSVICVSVISGAFFVGCGKAMDDKAGETYTPYFMNGAKSLNLPKDQNYRIDTYDDFDNLGMFFEKPSIQAFHSIVPKSIMEFYPFVDVDRGVASRPEVKNYGLRTLLSVKYLLDYQGDTKEFKDKNGDMLMSGFEFVAKRDNFNIYENKNYVPIGFTYNFCMSEKTAEKYGKALTEFLMLKAVMLSDKDIKKYEAVLPENKFEEYPLFGADEVANDAAQLKQHTVTDFKRDNTGFSGNIKLEVPNLVFFTVPYESGWSATVDGKKAEIIQANKGFMSVLVPEGTHKIRFNYMTPGLLNGIYVFGASLLVYILYLLICFLYRRDHKEGPNPKIGAPAFVTVTDTKVLDDTQAELHLSEIGDQTQGSFFDLPSLHDVHKKTAAEPEKSNEREPEINPFDEFHFPRTNRTNEHEGND